jgi:N-acetylneuraminic acid mutarotase
VENKNMMLTKGWTLTVLAGAVGAVGCAGAKPEAAPAKLSSAVQASATPQPTVAKQESAAPPQENFGLSGPFVAAMPRGLTSFGGATLNGAFYLVGGYGGEPHNYTAEGQSRDVWKMQLSPSPTWTKVATLPQGLQGLAVAAYGDEVCRFGGNRVEPNPSGKPLMLSVADAACLNTKTFAWRPLPSLPKGRSSLDAATIGSTVYLAGGWQLGDGQKGGNEQSGEWARDILQLDLAATQPSWKSIAAPVQTRAAGVVAAGGKLYLMGGLTADKKTSRTVHVFDPKNSTWSQGPDLPSDGFGMATIDGVGDKVIAATRDGVVYELQGTAWKTRTKLTFPRLFHRLAWRTPDQLLAIGGITGMQTHGRTLLVEQLGLGSSSSATEVARVSIAFPGQAKNRQAVFAHEDFLYMFGGNNSLEQHEFEPANFVDEGHRLHLPSLTWSKVAPFPQKRQSMQVAWVGDKLLALGGFGHNGKAAVSFNEGYWFSAESETWTSAQGLPAGRTQFGLASAQDQVFVFGGLNYDPDRKQDAFDHVTKNLVQKPSDGQAFADLGAPLPGPRRAFGGVALGDEYFIVGGMRENFKLVDDCLRYSFKTKQYQSMPCPPKTRLSARLLAIGDKVYAVAGNTRNAKGALEADRSIDVFDPKTSQWSVHVADVGFDTHHANVAAYNGQIVMASTQNKEGKLQLAFIRTQN